MTIYGVIEQNEGNVAAEKIRILKAAGVLGKIPQLNCSACKQI